jgi:hypothetical protein
LGYSKHHKFVSPQKNGFDAHAWRGLELFGVDRLWWPRVSDGDGPRYFFKVVMIKNELSKYPLSIEVIDGLVLFMVYHQIHSIAELIEKKDEDLQQLDGFQAVYLEAVHLIRGKQLN